LGKCSYFFKSYYNEKPLKLILSKEKTELELELAPKEFIILKAVGGIKLDKGEKVLVNVVSESEIPCTKRKVNIKMKSEKKISSEVIYQIPQKSQLLSIKINGRNISYQVDNNKAIFRVNLVKNNKFEIYYRPQIVFASPKEEILNFLTLDKIKNKNDYILVIGNHAPKEDLISAERIDAYFAYYFARQKDPRPDIIWHLVKYNSIFKIPIVKAKELTGRKEKNIIIIGGPETNEIARQYRKLFAKIGNKDQGIIQVSNIGNKKILYIAGGNSEATKEATLKYLSLLDEKYPYYGR